MPYSHLTQEERFLSHVNKSNLCWLWEGCIETGGYGSFKVGSKMQRAHRVSYTLFKGIIPEGKLVLHQCDIRLCVNPDHLYLGVQQENVDDSFKRSRRVSKVNKSKATVIQHLYECGVSVDYISKSYGIGKSYTYMIIRGEWPRR